MGKGARYERKLVAAFAEDNWFVIRSPASGSANDNPLPDVLAAKNGHVIAMELKFSSQNIAYLKQSELDSIRYTADQFNGVALAVGRWKYDTNFYGFPIPMMGGPTDSGRYSIKEEWKEDALVLPPDVPKNEDEPTFPGMGDEPKDE
jgi:Holliday junction resolvase